jgi:hypothetical protein
MEHRNHSNLGAYNGVCHSTHSKIQDKVQTVLQCRIKTNQITEHGGEEREVAVGHQRLAVAEKLKKAEMLLSWQRMKREEEELGLQILRALFIMRFLVVFLMVFMMFLLAPSICSCCNRGVEGKVGGKVKVFRCVGLWRRKLRVRGGK